MSFRRAVPYLFTALALPLIAAACSSGSADSDGGEVGGSAGAAGTAGGSSGGAGTSGKGGTSAGGKGGTGGSGIAGASASAGSAGASAAGSAGAAGQAGAGASSGAAGAAGAAGGAAGSGSTLNCPVGRGDCNGDPADGCELDTTNSAASCGACGNACEAGANQTATCKDSVCGAVCNLGFADCDGSSANGCETNTNTDVAHCGACGAAACPTGANGTAVCDAGTCGFSCAPQFGDCDGKPENGCEASLANDPTQCGSCNNACDAGTKCAAGGCECATSSFAAELLPIDLFVMLDQSASMDDPASNGKTRWQAVRDALNNFVSSAPAGVGVGLQYFPRTTSPQTPDVCTTDAQCGGKGPCTPQKVCNKPAPSGGYPYCDVDGTCASQGGGTCVAVGQCAKSGATCLVGAAGGCPGNQKCVGFGYCDQKYCSVDDYAAPDVAITAMPAGAASITTSLAAHKPSGQTPTGPALEGATKYASEWAKTHPGHVVAVVLATDGFPSKCLPQAIPDIAAVASAAVKASPKVYTFVIGVFDQASAAGAQSNLDAIAVAGGGQTKATIISTGDVTAQFQTALDDVRKSAVGCDYKIPQPTTGTLDYGLVNVILTPSSGGAQTLKGVDSLSACGVDGGWAYDNASAPTKISLCPASCTKAQAAVGNKVDISLGCATRKD